VRQQPNAAEEVVWSRSCTLPEYYAHPGDATSQKLYRSFDKALEPTLYYPWVMRNLNDLQANPMWQSTLRVGFEHVTPILLERPLILFSVQRGGPHPPPERPFENIPPPFRNFLLEYSPEQFTFGYDESRMSRAVWCCWLGPDHFILQSFGTLNGKPRASEFSEYNWEPSKGLVRTAGLELSGSYLTFPLNLIRLTIAGALTLRPPVPPNHYHTLTTNEKFWTEVSSWTDLL
jgi:hypothetical protein